jgi:hypothetical protein
MRICVRERAEAGRLSLPPVLALRSFLWRIASWIPQTPSRFRWPAEAQLLEIGAGRETTRDRNSDQLRERSVVCDLPRI